MADDIDKKIDGVDSNQENKENQENPDNIIRKSKDALKHFAYTIEQGIKNQTESVKKSYEKGLQSLKEWLGFEQNNVLNVTKKDLSSLEQSVKDIVSSPSYAMHRDVGVEDEIRSTALELEEYIYNATDPNPVAEVFLRVMKSILATEKNI